MCWGKIEGLPFGFEIWEDRDGWNLVRHGKFLTCRKTLEEIFDVMCRLHTSQIENPAST